MTNFIPFEDLIWSKLDNTSEQAVVRFENGFGASILRGTILNYSKNEQHLCQVAVLYQGRQIMNTPVTEGHHRGVLNKCTEKDVEEALEKISKLKTMNGRILFEEGQSHAG